MSYSINIAGHINSDSPDEARTVEEEIVDKVSEFVDELEGVSMATVTGQYIGQQIVKPLT